MRALLAVTSLSLLVAGCSSSGATSTDTTSTGTTGATGTTTSTSGGAGGSAATSTSSASTGSGGSPFDAGGPVTTYTTGFGVNGEPAITLNPGDEQTNCITIHLGNTEGGYVRRVTADLSQGSHHMIVYKSSDTSESPTPTKCYGLEGILEGQHPFFIAQQAHAQLDWPDDSGNPVGFEIEPNQMVHIEFHTINTTQSTITVTGQALIDTIPLTTANVIKSDLAFWGTKNIDIPPGPSSFDTGVQYQYGIPGTKSFAVTTHQHHLGTQMQVWYGADESGTTDRIANGLSWADPPLNIMNPPIEFPTDGSKLLTYECHWIQPDATTQPVKFGESFNDEMCFLWHYYYPSQGFQVCMDRACLITP